MNDYKKGQWIWMMKYCKDNRLSPAQKRAWDEALKAYKNKGK